MSCLCTRGLVWVLEHLFYAALAVRTGLAGQSACVCDALLCRRDARRGALATTPPVLRCEAAGVRAPEERCVYCACLTLHHGMFHGLRLYLAVNTNVLEVRCFFFL